MIAELKNIIHKIEQLSSEKQLEIAQIIEDEIQWDNTLLKTQDQLSNLAEEALKEYHSDKIKEDW